MNRRWPYVFLIVLALFLLWLKFDSSSLDPSTDGTSTLPVVTNTPTTPPTVSGGINDSTNNNNSVVVPAPNLTREIVFSNTDLSEEAKEILKTKIADLRVKLLGNNPLVSDWLELGVNLKIVGDYVAAREVWEHVKILAPDDFIVRLNLADLYAYYIKDYVLAEKNYLEAIDKNLIWGPSYLSLANFYLEVLHSKEKAKTVLREGIDAGVSNKADLEKLLNSLN